MKVQDHYNSHLANFYSWMIGDFESEKKSFKNFCLTNNIISQGNGLAVDLGAGNGIQTISLAELGFMVTAVDFNEQLLSELQSNISNYKVRIVEDNILNISRILGTQAVELIVCCGDTIAHLETFDDLKLLFTDCYSSLQNEGELILSFRDYSIELTESQRFIAVKSDESRILTCVLDYSKDSVLVTDLLHEKVNGVWHQKVSSYRKLRLTPNYISDLLCSIGFRIVLKEISRGMVFVIAQKI